MTDTGFGYGLYSYPTQDSGNNCTGSPARIEVAASGKTKRWLALAAERIAPEVCEVKGVAHNSRSRHAACTRTKWVNPGFLARGTALRAETGIGSVC